MRSFASTLIILALAILTSAAPIALPGTHSVSAPSVQEGTTNPTLVSRSARADSSWGQPSPVVGPVEFQRRDVDPKITDAGCSIQSQVRPRADTPSIAAIYTSLLNKMEPYTSPLNTTNATDIVSSIQASTVQALSELDALNYQPPSVIMASADGSSQMSVPQLAPLIAGALKSYYRAAANVLDVDPLVMPELDDVFDDIDDVFDDTDVLLQDTAVPVYGISSSLMHYYCPREGTVSIASIYTSLLNKILPYTGQLSTTNVTDIVSSIKASVIQALCEIEALNYQLPNVIMASADDGSQLSVSQLIPFISEVMKVYYRAAANILDVDPQARPALDDLLDGIDDLYDSTENLVEAAALLIYGVSSPLGDN